MVRRFTWLWMVAALAGCAPGNPGLVILSRVSPDEQCMYSVSGTVPVVATLDVGPLATGTNFVAVMRVGNQLINLGQSGATGVPMADPNLVQIQESEIELRDVTGAPLPLGGLPNPFRWPAQGFVPSSDGTEVGEGLATLELIPPAYATALASFAPAQIVASVRAIGVTAGGSQIESSEFLQPITLCSGCLFGCMVDDDNRSLCVLSCSPGQDRISYVPQACPPDTIPGC